MLIIDVDQVRTINLSMHKLKSGEPSKLFTLHLRELNQKSWLNQYSQHNFYLIKVSSSSFVPKYLSNLPKIFAWCKGLKWHPPNLSNVFSQLPHILSFVRNSDVNVFFYLPKSVLNWLKTEFVVGFELFPRQIRLVL